MGSIIRQSGLLGSPEYEAVRKHFVALGKLDGQSTPTLTALGALANPSTTSKDSAHAIRAFALFLETGVDRRRVKPTSSVQNATPGVLVIPAERPELNQYKDRRFAANIARARAAQPHIVPALAGIDGVEYSYEYDPED